MNKKKILIISSVVIILLAIALGFYYFVIYKKDVKNLTEQDKLNILDQLTKDSKSNFTTAQKVDILNNLSTSANSVKAKQLTTEERMKILQSDSR